MSKIKDDPELIKVFQDEAHSEIDRIKRGLNRLEERLRPQATRDKKSIARSLKITINKLVRSTHTLKGAAAAMEFNNMRDMALALLNIFKATRDKKIEIKPDVIPLLSEGIEACRRLLENKKVKGHNKLLAKLRNIS